MAVTVKKAILWRRDVDNSPEMLANIIQPLSEAGADLRVGYGLSLPGNGEQSRHRAVSGFRVHSSKALARRSGTVTIDIGDE
jgi:hypothetical protein